MKHGVGKGDFFIRQRGFAANGRIFGALLCLGFLGLFLIGCILVSGCVSMGGKEKSGSTAGELQYFPFSVDEDNLSGAVDFSFLNQPLTAADRIFTCGNHFCRVGADLKPNTKDDQRVRLFGVSFTQLANFPAAEDAIRIARRLRRLGINIVRLHYLDRSLARDLNDVKGVLTDKPYPTLNPVAIDRLRGFIKALSAQGIYVDLNLHVVYQFRPKIDGLPDSPIPEHSKPLYHFFPAMVDLEVEYAKKLIAALDLKSDPALALVEISNESSLVYSWLLSTRYPKKWRLDSVVTGSYADSLRELWSAYSSENEMPMRASDSAESKKFLSFLSDLDKKYFEKMKEVVASSTNDLVPVSGTQMLYGSLVGLDTQQNLDFLDNHFYYDFYIEGKDPRLVSDWRIRNKSLIEPQGMEGLSNLAFFRSVDKPYSISEFNQPWPNEHSAEMLPMMAAIASFQDWDALMYYQYRDDRGWDVPGLHWFNLSGDPSKLAGFGQAAWLFRTGQLKVAREEVTFNISPSTRAEPVLKGLNPWQLSQFFLTKFDASPLLPLMHRVGVRRANKDNISTALKPPAGNAITSDTSELRYLQKERLFTIVSDRVVGAFGFLGPNGKINLGEIGIKNPDLNELAVTLLATCLDGSTLNSCSRLLISNSGGTLGAEKFEERARPRSLDIYPGTLNELTFLPKGKKKDGHVSEDIRGEAPVFMQRRNLEFSIRMNGRKAKVYLLDGAGHRVRALENVLQVGGGEVTFQLGGTDHLSPWYEIVIQ